MFKTFLFFYVFKHPVTAHVILMPSCNTKQSSMICHYSSTEFWNVFVKIHQKFRLLSINYIIKMNVFVAPFKIMNDSSICELLFHDEEILKEFSNVFFDVYMRVLSYHCSLLITKILLVFLNQYLSIIYDVSNIIKNAKNILFVLKCFYFVL